MSNPDETHSEDTTPHDTTIPAVPTPDGATPYGTATPPPIVPIPVGGVAPAAGAVPVVGGVPAAGAPGAPVGPAAPAGRAPATGTWQTVVGIILAALSIFSLPRGLVGIVVTLTQPGMVSPAEPLGVATFGAALLALGIVLMVRGSRIRRANRAAAAQAGYPIA